MASKPRLYPNRLDQNVSYDSIGLTCFATVGGSKSNGQLAQHEKTHVCDSAFLAERGILTAAEGKRHFPTHARNEQPHHRHGEAA